MSAYPIVLEGSALRALVVGGGAVATRKVRGLVVSGAAVRVIALEVHEELQRFERECERLTISRGSYESEHLVGVQIVFAATNDLAVNEKVALDARNRGILVNVADAPQVGDFATPAVHRAGDLVISVVAGGVPSAAARIRDEIGVRFDHRYDQAVALLRSIRADALARGDRDLWAAANAALVGDDFCGSVESGELVSRSERWR